MSLCCLDEVLQIPLVVHDGGGGAGFAHLVGWVPLRVPHVTLVLDKVLLALLEVVILSRFSTTAERLVVADVCRVSPRE